MSFFVRPKPPISSKTSSKFLIFVQIKSSYWKEFDLQTDKYVLISRSAYRNAAVIYITVDLFYWKVRVQVHN